MLFQQAQFSYDAAHPHSGSSHAKNDRTPLLCRSDARLRRVAFVLCEHHHSAGHAGNRQSRRRATRGDAWRESCCVHGRRLRARLEQARHLPVSGHRHHQSRGRHARCAHGGLAGDRHYRRAERPAALPSRLSERRRQQRLGRRHQGQLLGRYRRALSRFAAPGVSRSHQRHARSGAS